MFDMVAGDQSVCFGVTFENGWRLSVSFLDGGLTRNTNKEIERYKFGEDIITIVSHSAPTVEIMVSHTVADQVYTHSRDEFWEKHEVKGGVIPNELIKIMAEVEGLPDPTKQGV